MTKEQKRVLDLIKQTRSEFETLATKDLSEDELAVVIPAFAEFYNSLKSAANYLAVLRKQPSRCQ